jgi:hypothetical protein
MACDPLLCVPTGMLRAKNPKTGETEMHKLKAALLSAMAVLLLIFAVSCVSTDTGATSYGEDRALIEDLQARYMFALDFGDVDTYVSTFTEDGVLDIGTGEIRGHEAIRKIIGGMPGRDEEEAEGEAHAKAKDTGPYPATGRHNITNIAIRINGDTAEGRAYWFHYGNNNPERKATLDSYGHYEDEMVKVNGNWLFSKRRIYNEQVADWIAKPGNPCW